MHSMWLEHFLSRIHHPYISCGCPVGMPDRCDKVLLVRGTKLFTDVPTIDETSLACIIIATNNLVYAWLDSTKLATALRMLPIMETCLVILCILPISLTFVNVYSIRISCMSCNYKSLSVDLILPKLQLNCLPFADLSITKARSSDT